jgi:hypothetical protein
MTTLRVRPDLSERLQAVLREKRALKPIAEAAAEASESFAHHAMPRKRRDPINAGRVDGEEAVINTNHGAHLEEYGEARTPVYAPLRRGARAVGLNLRERRK